ncbi:hypothetical protein, partial [Acinetobacter baumannii]
QYFAVIDDAGIPVDKTGRVSGIVSAIGYLPDVFMYTMVGGWFDTHPGKAGFDMMFIYAIIMGLMCIVFSLLLAFVIRRKKITNLEK